MIPKPKKRNEEINDILWLEDWITQKMRIEKILGTYKPRWKKKKL